MPIARRSRLSYGRGDTLNNGVAHYQINFGAFNPGFPFRWPTFHDHEFADSFPPQSIHEDVCTSVGGLDQTVWKVTIVVRIVQTHAAEVRTERHTVSHNATVFVSTLQKKKCKQSGSH